MNYFHHYCYKDLDHQGGVRIIPRIESCRSDYMTVFVGCIYAYKGLLMVSGYGFHDHACQYNRMDTHQLQKYVYLNSYLVHFSHGRQEQSKYQH